MKKFKDKGPFSDCTYSGDESMIYDIIGEVHGQADKLEDLLDKLGYKKHCYRDTISGVEGSFIIYPGVSSIVFPAPDSKALDNGVGALALRPDTRYHQNDNANSFLHAVISSFWNAVLLT